MKIKIKRLMQEAMALSIPPNASRSLVPTGTYFVVVFSILVQSLTVGRVIRVKGGPLAAPQSSPGR
jgi:CPA1 family monovalent cation:H+ antiporter